MRMSERQPCVGQVLASPGQAPLPGPGRTAQAEDLPVGVGDRLGAVLAGHDSHLDAGAHPAVVAAAPSAVAG